VNPNLLIRAAKKAPDGLSSLKGLLDDVGKAISSAKIEAQVAQSAREADDIFLRLGAPSTADADYARDLALIAKNARRTVADKKGSDLANELLSRHTHMRTAQSRNYKRSIEELKRENLVEQYDPITRSKRSVLDVEDVDLVDSRAFLSEAKPLWSHMSKTQQSDFAMELARTVEMNRRSGREIKGLASELFAEARSVLPDFDARLVSRLKWQLDSASRIQHSASPALKQLSDKMYEEANRNMRRSLWLSAKRAEKGRQTTRIQKLLAQNDEHELMLKSVAYANAGFRGLKAEGPRALDEIITRFSGIEGITRDVAIARLGAKLPQNSPGRVALVKELKAMSSGGSKPRSGKPSPKFHRPVGNEFRDNPSIFKDIKSLDNQIGVAKKRGEKFVTIRDEPVRFGNVGGETASRGGDLVRLSIPQAEEMSRQLKNLYGGHPYNFDRVGFGDLNKLGELVSSPLNK